MSKRLRAAGHRRTSSKRQVAAAKACKNLRFAALVRVSTEKQAKQGESLRTQSKQIEHAVTTMDGTIPRWFRGQEKVTVDAVTERKLRDQMLQEAEKPNRAFDAVIVAHEDRWSRNESQSGNDLDRLLNAGVRFFVLTNEHDLSDPTARLWLAMSASIGRYHARNQSKKSIENRIERAERGAPTCGKLPWGRDWDGSTWQWSVKPECRLKMERCAKRYLAGEGMPKIAESEGCKWWWLHKTLTTRCGSTWLQTFNNVKVEGGKARIVKGEKHVVRTEVPPLLDDETISAIHRRIEANKTFTHGQRGKYRYLLSGMVFCDHCGYALTGQPNHGGRNLAYRHAPGNRRVESCEVERHCYIPAPKLDELVLNRLFETFGNVTALRNAIARAVPNQGAIEQRRAELKRLESELVKIDQARDRLLDLADKGSILQSKLEDRLASLNQREATTSDEIEQHQQSLANVPKPEEIDRIVERFSKSRVFRGAYLRCAKDRKPKTSDEQRGLCQAAFDGHTDGRRNGVYIRWSEDGKKWTYQVCGRLWLDDQNGVARLATY